MSWAGERDAARRAVVAAQVAAAGEADLAAVAERVAVGVAEAERPEERAATAERFVRWIGEGAFVPSVPTLANLGGSGQLAACFVLEVDDSVDSIYDVLRRAARIQQGSGGVGVEFSALRPRGTAIERSGGRSPGPLPFIELFTHSAGVMSLAGRRSGAHLAILRDDHPDVLDFVRAGRDRSEALRGMGRALSVSDVLIAEARRGGTHELQGGSRICARDLLDEVARTILASGDPTLLFVDRIEAHNPAPHLGRLRATNPCGEQPLLPNESCVLGSLQLPAFVDVERGAMDWPRLADATHDAVRFLDDVIDVAAFPDAEIERATLATRKVGLGVMGLADVLLLCDTPYGSAGATKLVDELLGRIAAEARHASAALARARGCWPAGEPIGATTRNASTLAIAPTGTIRLIAGCSGGIEPWIAPALSLATAEGDVLRWSDRWLASWLERRASDPEAVLDGLAAGVAAHELPGLADRDRELLRRAWEIPPEEQIGMQALAQRHVDGAVSKTVHVRVATRAEIVAWIHAAHERGCKGVAFYAHPEGARPSPDVDLCRSCAPG